jgi:hypothetical protein
VIPYPSIESVWKREGKLLVHGNVRQPENELVCSWIITEKVDGMNIRLGFSEAGLDIRGRTDNAQFKQTWLDFLKGLVDVEKAKDILCHPTREDWQVTVYGELYGPGIQKGGTCTPELSFRAFDVLYGGRVWADVFAMRNVAAELGLESVPILGEAQGLESLPSTAAEMDAFLGTSLACPNGGRMEGFVAKPGHVLLNAKGERVMYKLTYRDVPDAKSV